MLTRRSLLATLPALPSALQALARRPQPQFVYFGTGTDQGIYRSTFDASTGVLTPPIPAATSPQTSFLAISPSHHPHRVLYAVNELSDAPGTVTSFTFNPTTGDLRQLNQVSAGGNGPCFISIDATGRAAFVANYSGHSLSSYRIQPHGQLSAPVSHFDCTAPVPCEPHGPNPTRQDSSHFHCATLSPNRFLFVNDLGADTISIFHVDSRTATLQPQQVLKLKPGSGPRHLAFHPNGHWVYSINELDCSIDRLLWNPHSAKLSAPQSTVSTLPPDFHAPNTAAEITLSSDGRFLYASNRGDDSLVVFTISPTDGALNLVQRISCGGKTPRHFTLDPTGRWLINANQNSATITVFRRDPASGQLTGPQQTVSLPSPEYTLFA